MATSGRGRGLLVVAGVLCLGVSFLAPSAAERPKCMGERATIVGTNGTERIVGTKGKDVIVAKDGADYILARGSADLVCAGAGDDHVDSGSGLDRVKSGSGDDSLVGGRKSKVLTGGTGSDIFFTRGGNGGKIRGGAGSDWITFVDRGCRPANVNLSRHEARYRNCDGSRTITWTIRGIENVEGGPRGDSLIGSRYSERLMGQEHRDTLSGRRGRDWLHGGHGYDTGSGGAGDDACVQVESRRSC